MPNKEDRIKKEMDNLFKDPKYARQAWKAIGSAILASPCTRLPESYDKDGNETFATSLDRISYNQLKKDIDSLDPTAESREPTEIEMIIKSQMLRARFDTQAAVFIRDTLGAKPVDESKVAAQVSNPYESLSDEELEAVAAMRERRIRRRKKSAEQLT